MSEPTASPPPTGDQSKPRAVARRRPRWLLWLMILGPGLIAANAGNDAGGIATYASAGSEFGYRTLFVMALVTIALIIVQEMSARLGAHTGEGLMSLIREQFPLRLSAFAIVRVVQAFYIICSQLSISGGEHRDRRLPFVRLAPLKAQPREHVLFRLALHLTRWATARAGSVRHVLILDESIVRERVSVQFGKISHRADEMVRACEIQ